jgi:hypothetical protein
MKAGPLAILEQVLGPCDTVWIRGVLEYVGTFGGDSSKAEYVRARYPWLDSSRIREVCIPVPCKNYFEDNFDLDAYANKQFQRDVATRFLPYTQENITGVVTFRAMGHCLKTTTGAVVQITEPRNVTVKDCPFGKVAT